MRPSKLLFVGAVLFGAIAPSASAQGDFSCRASAARFTGLGSPPLVTVEPVRANAGGAPCSDQSASTLAPTTVGPAGADSVGAFTARDPAGGGASALASASHAHVDLP